MSVKSEDIIAALKKLGCAVSPGELADHMGISTAALGTGLKPLLDAGTLVATGVTKSRRVGLPGQKADDKPRLPKKPRKAKKAAAQKPRKKAKRTKTKEAAPASFVPALAAGGRLVIINGDDVLIFERPESQSIREVFQQYKA